MTKIRRHHTANLGPVLASEADALIADILAKKGEVWVKDFSTMLFETGTNEHYFLREGYCWVVKPSMTQKGQTIYRDISENIGQTPDELADEEIARMEASTERKWCKDYSEFLIDDNFVDPMPLQDGYCWVVTDKP